MSEILSPMIEEEREKPPARLPDKLLMTELGVIEGEVLTYLEEHGATTLRRLVRELEWPAPLVMMAVGALVRAGLIHAIRHELEVIVACIDRRVQSPPGVAPVVWGR